MQKSTKRPAYTRHPLCMLFTSAKTAGCVLMPLTCINVNAKGFGKTHDGHLGSDTHHAVPALHVGTAGPHSSSKCLHDASSAAF